MTYHAITKQTRRLAELQLENRLPWTGNTAGTGMTFWSIGLEKKNGKSWIPAETTSTTGLAGATPHLFIYQVHTASRGILYDVTTANTGRF